MSQESSPTPHNDIDVPSVDLKVESTGDNLDASFQLGQEVARGGMGIIYKGFHRNLERDCAIKVLNPLQGDETALKRFIKEARLVSSLDHPNIVKIFSVGFDKLQRPFIAMEWLQGQTLAMLLAKRRLTLSEFRSIFEQIMSALQYAHECQIVHRDIKPSNIFLLDDGHGNFSVRILDFGIARSLDQSNSMSGKLTSTGSVLGSPSYMSPEQCAGEQTDERSDIYSLAVMIYEALSGRPPFIADNALELMYKQMKDLPDRSLLPTTLNAQALNDCVLKALSKQKVDRYNSLKEFFREFQNACAELSEGDFAISVKSDKGSPSKSKVLLPLSVLLVALIVVVIAITGVSPQRKTAKSSAVAFELHNESNSTLKNVSCTYLLKQAAGHEFSADLAMKKRDYVSAKKEFDAAIAKYREAIAVGTKNIQRMQQQSRKGRIQEQRKMNIIDEWNNVYNASHDLGYVLFNTGQLSAANEAFDRNIQFAKSNQSLIIPPTYMSAMCLDELGETDESLALLLAQSKVEPPKDKSVVYWGHRADLFDHLGLAYYYRGSPAEARRAFQEAISSAKVVEENHSTDAPRFFLSRLALVQDTKSETRKAWSLARASAENPRFDTGYYVNFLTQYGEYCRRTEPDKAPQIFRSAIDAVLADARGHASKQDAMQLAACVVAYGTWQMNCVFKAPDHTAVYQNILDRIIADAEKYLDEVKFETRLASSVSFLKGGRAFVQHDYPEALKQFDYAIADSLSNPLTPYLAASLLRGETLKLMGKEKEANEQFLKFNSKQLSLISLFCTCPEFMFQSVQDCADAFKVAGKIQDSERIQMMLGCAKEFAKTGQAKYVI